MIAVDTNILVYAHREDSPWHGKALEKITTLAKSGTPWAINVTDPTNLTTAAETPG